MSVPLDPSAGVCLVKQKVEGSISPETNFHPVYLKGRGINQGYLGGLGREKEKEMVFINCVASLHKEKMKDKPEKENIFSLSNLLMDQSWSQPLT
jgi:hypothetical protein